MVIKTIVRQATKKELEESKKRLEKQKSKSPSSSEKPINP